MLANKSFFYSFLFSLVLVIGLFGIVNVSFSQVQTERNKVQDLKNQASALNPGGLDEPGTLIGRFTKLWIAGIGMLALVFVFVAGVMYMSSAGNADKIRQSAMIIVWVILGLTATLGSYMILSQLFEFIE